MSLHAAPHDIIPEQTIQVARAAFPKGSPYMRMRDALGPSIRTQHWRLRLPGAGSAFSQ
jgi:hypothetical protein